MDVATPPRGDGEYRYLLVMVDLFSHYIELAPLYNQTVDAIVEKFKRSWIYRGHGVPKILLTDQGHNVDGREVRNMCETLGVEKRHATAYHPQADRMAERSIGTVKQTIRCLLLERKMEHGSWPKILPEISFLLNSVTNASSNVSPHMLTFGRRPRAPTDIPISGVARAFVMPGPASMVQEKKGKAGSYLQGDSYRKSVDDLSLYTSTRGESGKDTGLFPVP